MKYIQSVIQLCRDEKLREMTSDQLSLSSLLFQAFPLFGEDNSRRPDEDGENFEQIDDKAEQKFLVLSWWLLYVGWKDVGERVRRSVEDVFERSVGYLHVDECTHSLGQRVFEGSPRPYRAPPAHNGFLEDGVELEREYEVFVAKPGMPPSARTSDNVSGD
jgi:hypothetical protein